MADGEAQAAALNSGFHLAYLIGAALVVVAIVVTLTVLRSEGSASSEEQEGEGRPARSSAEPACAEAA